MKWNNLIQLLFVLSVILTLFVAFMFRAEIITFFSGTEDEIIYLDPSPYTKMPPPSERTAPIVKRGGDLEILFDIDPSQQ